MFKVVLENHGNFELGFITRSDAEDYISNAWQKDSLSVEEYEPKFANLCLYSDVMPYEIVRKVSNLTYEVRRMKTVRNFNPEFVVGGFSAICTNNNEQNWICEVDKNAPIKRVRYSKAKGVFRDKSGSRFSMTEHPIKKYDYNF